MLKITAQFCGGVKGARVCQGIKFRVQEAERLILLLIQDCDKCRPYRRGDTGAAVKKVGRTTAIAGLTDEVAGQRIGRRGNVGHRTSIRARESILIGRPAEETTDTKSTLSAQKAEFHQVSLP